jgi:hypothetical protein
MKKSLSLLLLLSFTLSACKVSAGFVPPTATATVVIPSRTPSETATLPPTPSATPTLTPSPTITPIPSPTPTYAILRGKVNVEKVSCRYGPGAPYLYLYGMRQGAVQDVIGRTDTGKWVLTRSHGDNKSCWVKTEFLNLNGDVMSLEIVYPDKYRIPPSNQGYLPPWDVAAVRHGDQVVVDWKSEALRPGDEESATMVIYIVEVWTCQDGQLTFQPFGTSLTQVTLTDEPGCSEPSHGRVYFQEKHGYAGPSEIPWPPSEPATQPAPTQTGP